MPEAVAETAENEAPPRAPSLARAALLCAAVAAAGLAADLALKAWAFERLLIAPPKLVGGRVVIDSTEIALVPSVLHLRALANEGAVFGLGQGQRVLFLAVSAVAVVVVLAMLRNAAGKRWLVTVLGLMLAGIAGNFYDRVRFGYVRDMLWALPGARWGDALPWVEPTGWAAREVFPWIFNLADSYLCVGVAVLVVTSLFAPNPRDPRVAREATQG